jgi:hypothetical protein
MIGILLGETEWDMCIDSSEAMEFDWFILV